MSQKFLSDEGLRYLWTKLKAKFVMQESGKGLSTNDYTTAEKTKLAGLENYTLPAATSGALGGIKVGGGLAISEGVLSTTSQHAVEFIEQALTDAQKTQARTNIGAGVPYVHPATHSISEVSGLQDALDAKATKVSSGTEGHIASLTSGGDLADSGYAASSFVLASSRAQPNGVATLGEDGKVPSSQLPSYVDDVIEGYYYNGKFYTEAAHTHEIAGETGKIYIDIATTACYRYSGTVFVVIASADMIAITNAEIDQIVAA